MEGTLVISMAQVEAAERDGKWCLWSKHRLDKLVRATDRHHLARRQPGSDVSRLIVFLSHDIHMRHHCMCEPSTDDLLDLMREVYGWDLRAEYPRFFGGS